MRKLQLGWLGHVLRRDGREPAKIFALYVPEHGRPGPGKPPTDYLRQVATLISSTPELVTAEHVEELANDKDKWHERTAAYRMEAN